MGMLRRLALRLRALLRRSTAETEMDDELRFHLEMEAERNVRLGMSPDEARRQARIAFGGVERYREELRDGRRVGWLEDAWADARYAARALRKSPGFAVVAIGTLALGIGATAAVFSVVNGILLEPLPYPEPDRLVSIHQSSAGNRWNISAVDYRAIVEQQRSFESVAALAGGQAALSGRGEPEWIRVGRVTAGFFRTLGVEVARGRGFQPGDDAPGAPPGVVVGHEFEQRHFGSGADALGRSIVLDGTPYTVVGVLPPSTRNLEGFRAQVWPILQLEEPGRRGPFLLRGIGRLRDGVPPDAAARDLAGISERIFPAWAASFQDRTARLTPIPLREAIIGDTPEALRVFAAAVVLVLLVGVANVANLVLVRSSGRQREIAVRAALGAGRGRLVRLLLVESLVIGVLGGLGGVAVAAAGVRALAALASHLPRIDRVSLDLPTLAFTAAVALVSGILVGAYPLAFGLSRNLASPLRNGGRRASAGRDTQLFQSALVVAEFGLALPLLLGAGLLLHSFLKLQRVDPGFEPAGLLTARAGFSRDRYPDSAAVYRFWDEALRRVRDVPGVVEVGLSMALPPDDPGDINNFDLVDRPVEPGSPQPMAPWSRVTPEYFRALGVPLLEGRTFEATDDQDSPPVVVVSRAWAERFYPGASAVGRRLRSGGCTECEPATVVGVVGDVKYVGLGGSGEAVYTPFLQDLPMSINLVVRTSVPPSMVVAPIRERIRALDPDLPLHDVMSMEERLYASTAEPRRWTVLLGAFATVAVVLAALGVFGVMSYVVSQRRQEIGVRIALGAGAAAVVGLVVRRGMARALLGSAIGLAVALPGARLLEGALFEVSHTDPATVAAVSALLLVVAFLACWIPGRRAARIDPVRAIAAE